MIQLLINNPLLLLFSVAALGFLLGRVKIAGSSLGVAAVLFVGLAFGALDPNMRLPELLYQLGLALFVYTVGLTSGPSFFAALRRKGLRDNALILIILLFAAGLTALAALALRLPATYAAGLFAGSLTNTPALAGVLESLKALAPANSPLLTEPVVAYSVAYPMGVVGTLLALALAQRRWGTPAGGRGSAAAGRVKTVVGQGSAAAGGRDDMAPVGAAAGQGAAGRRDDMAPLGAAAEQGAAGWRGAGSRTDRAPAANGHVTNRTVLVTRSDVAAHSLEELSRAQGWAVVFGRVRRAGRLSVADGRSRLEVGDTVSVVGAPEALERVAAYLGQASDERLDLDRSQLDNRRIFVSDPNVAGLPLSALNLPARFGAVVTRVRRGDVEFVPHGGTVLELGDRVRVLTQPETMPVVSAYLGDSYRALSEIDILSFGLGLALGLLLGVVPLPLPGGVTLTLGLAGGPLIVALVLGARHRTGPLVWSLPYSANLTLRQLGLILFLAGVGTRAGYAFFTTLAHGAGLAIFVVGALVTTLTAAAMLWAGHRLLKIPMGQLAGMLAGLQTQPAVLGFALESAGTEEPNVGYASVYPVAMIAKIILAQLLLALLK